MSAKYRDKKGRVLFVTDGFSAGRTWMTAYCKPNGMSIKRLVNAGLPLRKTRGDAEADLQKYAEAKQLEKVEE